VVGRACGELLANDALYAAIEYAPATSLAEGILKIKQGRETP